ncbi:MAG TPA: hypothetical protein VFH44_12125 [Solirubrobacterales bacterium]|nr:hypothetical protein [Solirubrobacterales bacterium]
METLDRPTPAPAPVTEGRVRSGFGAQAVLAMILVAIAFGFVAIVTRATLPTKVLPAPFPDQHQDAETLTFLFTFGLALPLALFAVTRIASRLGTARAIRLEGMAALLAPAIPVALLLTKVAERTDVVASSTVIVAALVAIALATVALIVAGFTDRFGPALEAAGRRSRPIWIGTGILAAFAALSFFELTDLGRVRLIVGFAALAAMLFLYVRSSQSRLSLPGWLGRAIDVGVPVLILLAVPNLYIFGATGTVDTEVTHFHQNFFIGPANHVLGGGTMLIDTLSQYGIGSIYFLVAWFLIAPIGDGTLGFIDNVLVALVFVGGFVVIRLAGVSRLLSAAAMTIAVLTLIFGLEYPLGALLQHGAIRFGLPMMLLAAATVEFAYPRFRRPAQAVELLTLGLSSIWALEGFAYTVLTAAAILAVRLWLVGPAPRWRLFWRWLGASVAACVAFHLALALGTLLAAGELPRWGWYLNTLREFLTGNVGDLTYDFVPWTAAFAVGALYVASTAGLVVLMRTRPDLVRERPARAIALAGTTAWGIALYSYFVNRSAEHILPYISLPALMIVMIWLSLLLDRRDEVSLATRTAGLGVAGALAVLMVAAAWPVIELRAPQSALAYAVPGGNSTLGEGFERLWDPPDLSQGATDGAELVERCMPDPERTFVLTDADLGIEILTKVERANAFPLSDPWEDSLVGAAMIPALRESMNDIRPGDRILVDAPAIATFKAYELVPFRNPLLDPIGIDALVPSGVAPLQEWILKELGRYRLRTVCRGGGINGFRVVEPVLRRNPPPRLDRALSRQLDG